MSQVYVYIVNERLSSIQKHIRDFESRTEVEVRVTSTRQLENSFLKLQKHTTMSFVRFVLFNSPRR
jgi:hypothetical protein